MRTLLIAFLMACSLYGWSLDPGHFTVNLISAPYFLVDANAPATITQAYVGFEVKNNTNSGITYSNLKLSVTSITSSVAGQNYALLSPASGVTNIGTLGPGESKTCYYYVSYPASVTPQGKFNIRLSDNTATPKTQSFVIRNRSAISSNAGGAATHSITNQDLIGGMIIDDVSYVVGNVQNNDECDFQVSVSPQFDATKITLLSTEVIFSSIPGIVAGTTDSLYFKTGNGSTGAKVTVRWTFRITSFDVTIPLLPCAGSTSGNTNYKYALNSSLGSGTPVTISPDANKLIVIKSSDETVYAINSPAIFTVTIQNPGAFGVTIDRITDELPAGFTYQSLLGSSEITGSNSTTMPVTGATGTITFESGTGMSGSSYYIPPGGSISVIYTATSSPSTHFDLVTNARGYVGLTQIGVSQNTVSVIALLPVKLISFNAMHVKEGIQLNWTTSSEINNKWFELQRSNGGNDFVRIATIPAAGGTSAKKAYGFVDISPGVTINTYRLKMIGHDNQFIYSQVVSIRSAEMANIQVRVSPNPFVDHLRISLDLDFETPIDITFYDNMGKPVLKKVYAGKKGANTFVVDNLYGLPHGSYILKVGSKKGVGNYKIVKYR